jgi:acetylornithine deacetylase/succinyl-diaminopimelate desuccinylase family protein
MSPTSGNVADVLRSIEASAQDIVAFASELIAIPTENPPGSEYERCSDLIAARLAQLGLSVEVVELAAGRRAVLAGVGEGQTVYLHGHYDVVPASAEGQFEPRVRDGRLWGRGSADMKGAVAAMTYALAALGSTALDGRVEIVLVPDEESGGELGSERLLQKGRLGRNGIAAILGEPTGGAIWNAHRGALTLRVTFRGKPAHVGLQHEGSNAFEAAIPLLHALNARKRAVEARLTAWTTGTDEGRRSILMLGGEVAGGHQFNVVPDRFTFTIERRFNPDEDADEERRTLLELIDAHTPSAGDVEVSVIQQAVPSGVDADSDLVRCLGTAAETVTGRSPHCRLCPGLLESRFYSAAGVPAVAYGPGELEVSHGPSESVEVARLIDHAKVYALTAAGLLRGGSRQS